VSDARRQKALVGVLVVLAAIAGWIYLVPLLGGDGGPAAPGRRARGGGAGPAGVEVARLEVARLEAAPRDYSPGRDPFRYGEPPPPPGPTPEELARAAAAEAARRAAEEEARRVAAALEAEAGPPEPPKPQPPAFQLTYLGSFGPPSRRIAVFTDGEEIYNALVGDVIDGRFVVADIGYESVAIKYVGFPDEPATRVAIGS